MALLFVGVGEKLVGDRPGIETLCRVIVPAVAKDADELGGKRVVEYLHDPGSVGAVGTRNRPLLDRLSGAFPEGLDVGEKWFVHCYLFAVEIGQILAVLS
jgi:hypothetical protein